MGSFFQQYGVEEERRNRMITTIVLSCLGVAILAIVGYFVFHNYPEKQVVKRFLQQLNTHNYQEAYREWGCTSAHPCPNYDYNRFLQDWGSQSKAGSPWKVVSTDSCRAFLTANVQAQGTEVQSLSVQRSDHSLGFAPSPECQERKWRWKQFFHRVFGGGSSEKS